MRQSEIINELRVQISTNVENLIDEKCILADAPYYNNIGDVLIWQGIVDFLNAHNKKLLNVSSCSTFGFPKLDKDITILLMGGGNFGDLYRGFQEFRKEIIQAYPDNRIVMFPQSVWYENKALIEEDAKIFATHKDLHLFARDQWSYDFMKKHFSANHIHLAPDMAFFIKDKRLEPYRNKENGKTLFFRRLDKEIKSSTPINIAESADTHDWPTVEHQPKYLRCVRRITGTKRFEKYHGLNKILKKGGDILAQEFILGKLPKIGMRFLAPYNKVITTRLHALILSVLLYKNVTYIDNSTGKLSAYTDTWLKDLDTVQQYGRD